MVTHGRKHRSVRLSRTVKGQHKIRPNDKGPNIEDVWPNEKKGRNLTVQIAK